MNAAKLAVNRLEERTLMSVTPAFNPSSAAALGTDTGDGLPPVTLQASADLVDYGGNVTSKEVVLGTTGNQGWLAVYDEVSQSYAGFDANVTGYSDIVSLGSSNGNYADLVDFASGNGQFALASNSSGYSVVAKDGQPIANLGVVISNDTTVASQGTVLSTADIVDANGDATDYQLKTGVTGDSHWVAIYNTDDNTFVQTSSTNGDVATFIDLPTELGFEDYAGQGGQYTQRQMSDSSYHIVAALSTTGTLLDSAPDVTVSTSIGIASVTNQNIISGSFASVTDVLDANGDGTDYQVRTGTTGYIGWVAIYDTATESYIQGANGDITAFVDVATVQNFEAFSDQGGRFTQLQISGGEYEISAYVTEDNFSILDGSPPPVEISTALPIATTSLDATEELLATTTLVDNSGNDTSFAGIVTKDGVTGQLYILDNASNSTWSLELTSTQADTIGSFIEQGGEISISANEDGTIGLGAVAGENTTNSSDVQAILSENTPESGPLNTPPDPSDAVDGASGGSSSSGSVDSDAADDAEVARRRADIAKAQQDLNAAQQKQKDLENQHADLFKKYLAAEKGASDARDAYFHAVANYRSNGTLANAEAADAAKTVWDEAAKKVPPAQQDLKKNADDLRQIREAIQKLKEKIKVDEAWLKAEEMNDPTPG